MNCVRRLVRGQSSRDRQDRAKFGQRRACCVCVWANKRYEMRKKHFNSTRLDAALVFALALS